jgi:hypothetical protein
VSFYPSSVNRFSGCCKLNHVYHVLSTFSSLLLFPPLFASPLILSGYKHAPFFEAIPPGQVQLSSKRVEFYAKMCKEIRENCPKESLVQRILIKAGLRTRKSAKNLWFIVPSPLPPNPLKVQEKMAHVKCVHVFSSNARPVMLSVYCAGNDNDSSRSVALAGARWS